jgi:hypothetical protein
MPADGLNREFLDREARDERRELEHVLVVASFEGHGGLLLPGMYSAKGP